MKKDPIKSTKIRKPDANRQVIAAAIAELLQGNPKQAFTFNQLVKELGITDRKTKVQVSEVLEEMATSQQLARDDAGSVSAQPRAAANGNTIEGRFEFVNARFGFVVPDAAPDVDDVLGATQEDIWVSADNVGNAQDGDRVRAVVFNSRNKRREGEIVEILARKRTEFVGKIQLMPRYAFVSPDHRRFYQDIFVKQDAVGNAKNGDKVIVRITAWGDGQRNAEGEVIDVLGRAGANETEMHAILAEFGLPLRFPAEVLRESEAINGTITAADIAARRDFRPVPTFTIDPEDAKDFDDALSLQRLPNGNWEIGVHIADVTHYIHPDTALEKEAFVRATSVYLVDRVVPMLPERLSNDLCSLRPHEDKLTFSAVFELDERGQVLAEWFGRTIIHSDRRFSYEAAQEGIETGAGDFAQEILLLNRLAGHLRDERFRQGAISFETVEVKFQLDAAGAPLAVYPKVRKDAHKLIEEFMLLANRRVADFVFGLKKNPPHDTMVYRVHDKPDPDRLQTFATFVKRFGYGLKVDGKQVADSLNALIDDLGDKPEHNFLQNLAVRTMAKAKYSTVEMGHFGLAFAHYSHFTSPIRRYPDMMAHRLLQHYLDGGQSVDKLACEAQCKHASEREKLASDAERASIKYKQVEFMQQMEDRVFDGIVTGVTEFGIFVEVTENSCEGLVRLSELSSDFYELDRENYRVVGTRTGRIIGIGDAVQVKVKDTNLEKRSIDFNMVDTAKGRPAPQARGRSDQRNRRDAPRKSGGRRR